MHNQVMNLGPNFPQRNLYTTRKIDHSRYEEAFDGRVDATEGALRVLNADADGTVGETHRNVHEYLPRHRQSDEEGKRSGMMQKEAGANYDRKEQQLHKAPAHSTTLTSSTTPMQPLYTTMLSSWKGDNMRTRDADTCYSGRDSLFERIREGKQVDLCQGTTANEAHIEKHFNPNNDAHLTNRMVYGVTGRHRSKSMRGRLHLASERFY